LAIGVVAVRWIAFVIAARDKNVLAHTSGTRIVGAQQTIIAILGRSNTSSSADRARLGVAKIGGSAHNRGIVARKRSISIRRARVGGARVAIVASHWLGNASTRGKTGLRAAKVGGGAHYRSVRARSSRGIARIGSTLVLVIAVHGNNLALKGCVVAGLRKAGIGKGASNTCARHAIWDNRRATRTSGKIAKIVGARVAVVAGLVYDEASQCFGA